MNIPPYFDCYTFENGGGFEDSSGRGGGQGTGDCTLWYAGYPKGDYPDDTAGIGWGLGSGQGFEDFEGIGSGYEIGYGDSKCTGPCS